MWITKDKRERAQTDELHRRGSGHGSRDTSDRNDPYPCLELVGRQDAKALIDSVAETHPKLTEELVPKRFPSEKFRRSCRTFCASAFPFAT